MDISTQKSYTKSHGQSFLGFKKKLQKYLNNYEIKKIEKAYSLASKAHMGQYRKTGEDYIEHPLSAASILADFEMDYETLMAAILHDVIEDTDYDKNYIQKTFGEKISELVDGVSKLDKINFSTSEEASAANLRKMLLAMSNDIRVILIKLADRKHNLETIDGLDIAKRKKIGRETLEIFAPIALRLGIHSLHTELEDLSFKSLYPTRYSVLREELIKTRGNRNEIMEKIRRTLLDKLSSEGVKQDITAREKHIYGIYKKMKQKGIKFTDINDIFGVRVLCECVDDCYRSLGIIHNLYTPIPGRFKDYIAIPKSNGYQSLHTSIFGPHGLPIEIQIRTNEMNVLAQSGIASHWLYKSKITPSIKNYTKEQQWISNLLSIQKDSGNPQEYLQSIKSDLNPGKVYVFTPKGKIIDLPKKSTTIDYAYAIHTDLGNNYSAAKIDDKLVSPNTILKNGQRVEIITKENLRPDPSWLNFVITEKARHSIRTALKSIKRNDAVRLGKKLLNSALQDFGFSISEIPDKTLKLVLNEYNTNKITDLYCDIGLGERIAKLVAMRIVPTNASQNHSKNSTAVLITGTEGLALSFAKCCYPVPGDSIIGKISQDKGIVVHRNQCKSVSNTKKRKDEVIDLSWDNEIDDVFDACIKIEVENKRGVLASISSEIAQSESNIVSVTYDDTKQTGHNNMTFVVTVDGLKSLNKLITKLRKTNHVLTVRRKKS